MSLRGKIAAGVTFIVLLLTGGFTYQSVRRQSSTMRNELIVRGEALVRNTAENFRLDLKLGGVARVRERVPLLQAQQDVAYVIVLDEKGAVLAQAGELSGEQEGSSPWSHAREYQPDIREYTKARDPMYLEVRSIVVKDANIYQISVALVGMVLSEESLDPLEDPEEKPALLGTLHIGMSAARTDREIRGMILRSLAIGGAVLVASLLLLAFVIEVIIRPIRLMTEAAERVATGDLSHRLELTGKGEISQLGKAFDEMTRKLQGSREELVRANEELRLWSEKLEKEVENRTHELQEANRDLKLAISVKEDFLRAVSHDLNGPLVNIAGICGMIIRKYADKLDEGVKDRLGRIQRNVEKLSDLIGDLLELSRIKSRRLPFSRIKIVDLIRDIRALFEFQLEEKGIEVVTDENLPELYCEKTRIKQIFHNFIDNAIKYMGQREHPRIRIGYEERADEHWFWVEDNGSGITPEDQKILFHVFRRGRSREVQKSPGRGIGLSLIKQIVETYGGYVEVKSTVGEGTRFSFSLAKSACMEETSDGGREGHDENPARG